MCQLKLLYMKRVLLFSFISVVLISCYTTKTTPINHVLDEWIGKSDYDLIQQRGNPQSLDIYGKGYLLTYTGLNPYNYTRWKTQFYVNENHVIYKWSSNEPNIKEKKKNTFGTVLLIACPIIGGLGLAVLTAP